MNWHGALNPQMENQLWLQTKLPAGPRIWPAEWAVPSSDKKFVFELFPKSSKYF